MMQRVINTERIPIKMWLTEIEEGAMLQARNLANLPFAFQHIALMPDAHQGYGMPIGAILAAENTVVPNAVGVDIGCGMCALRTPLRRISRTAKEEWSRLIPQRIPTGHKHHKQVQDLEQMPLWNDLPPIVEREFESARAQIGTLGGGNHFIELQKGSDGYLWLMLHSGSRNIGKQVADYYNQLARKLNEQWHSKVPANVHLAYLPLQTKEAQLYIREMEFCVAFALANRRLLMSRAAEVLMEVVNQEFPIETMIHATHNYASAETHFGKELMIHRKGATSANENEPGIIPGSQGSPSFIVRGKGNPEAFCSCAHGAGRKMGRRQAQRALDLAKEQKHLNDLGVTHRLQSPRDLDEAPGAYKNIETVMQLQNDLVEVVTRLHPLVVVKG